MIGKRLLELRVKFDPPMTQPALASEIAAHTQRSYTYQAVQRAEKGGGMEEDALVAVSNILNVSTDYLLGLSDDPISTTDRLSENCPTDWVMVKTDVVSASGVSNGEVRPFNTGVVPFRRVVLEVEGIDASDSAIYQVSGDSMTPTLTDGCAILVDYSRNIQQDGCIYVFQDRHRLLVKRAKRDDERRWFFVSDNPVYAPIPIRKRMNIYGEVRWMSRLLGTRETTA